MTVMLQCYNKGCGKTYNPDENSPDACLHHPGQPKFHDAYKGWTCCTKKSTDFSVFLSFPGCTKSAHSNEKPVEPVKEKSVERETPPKELIEQRKAPELVPRPTTDEPLVEISRTISPSLLTNLQKLVKIKEETASNAQQVPVGTPCKNNTCKVTYQDESTNDTKCIHHPGMAVFHEGMKYWSCCQRKTSDFDNFLNQEGCTVGKHVWFKVQTENVLCKHDFHQAGNNFAILTVYSKNSVPDSTTIKANKIKLDIDITYDGGNKTFKKSFDLFGVIKVEESKAEFYGTKVEIKLKKADVVSWPKLDQ